MQRFLNQIMPTPEQREKIRPLVYQAAEDLRRLRRDTAHSTELILERLQDQIVPLLTPEQRDRVDEMIQKSRNAFKRYNFEQQLRQAAQRRQQEQREPQPELMVARGAAPEHRFPRPGAMHGQARELRQGRKAATVTTSSQCRGVPWRPAAPAKAAAA